MHDSNLPQPTGPAPEPHEFSLDQTTKTQHLPTVRPLGITVIIVLCVIGGLLGFGSSFFGAIGLIFGEMFATAMNGGDADTPEAKMQAAMQAVAGRFFIPNLLLLATNLFLSLGLLIGAFGLAKSKAWAIKLLRNVFLIGVFFEIIRAALGSFVQLQNAPIMQQYFKEISEKQQGPDLAAMSGLFLWGGIAFAVVWAITKTAMLLWGWFYLGKHAHSPNG